MLAKTWFAQRRCIVSGADSKRRKVCHWVDHAVPIFLYLLRQYWGRDTENIDNDFIWVLKLIPTFGIGQSSISLPILIRWRQTIARWNCLGKMICFGPSGRGQTHLQKNNYMLRANRQLSFGYINHNLSLGERFRQENLLGLTQTVVSGTEMTFLYTYWHSFVLLKPKKVKLSTYVPKVQKIGFVQGNGFVRLSAPLEQILSLDILAVIKGTTLHSNAGSSWENLFQRLTRILTALVLRPYIYGQFISRLG